MSGPTGPAAGAGTPGTRAAGIAPPSVTTTLVTLKLHLLRNGLRRSRWQVVTLVIAVLYGLGVAVLVVGGLVGLRGAEVGTAAMIVVPLGSALVLGWAVVPLVAFGADATLDPARLAPFAVPARRLVPGLLLAGLVGVPGVVTAVAGAATVVTWSRGPGTALVAAVGAALAVLTCVALSRLTTTGLAAVLGGRRSRELIGTVVLLVVAVGGPVLAIGSSALSEPGGVDAALAQRVASWAGWTPLGWAWSAPAEVAAGSPGAGAVKLALAAALLVAVLTGWAAALSRALQAGGATSGAARAGGRRGARARREPALLAALETTTTGVVAARCLRYWRRDARYLAALGSLLVVPLLVLLLPVVLPVDPSLAQLALGPALAFVVGWTSHDDVAYDGTAVWLHLSAGVPGRADRWGRSIAVLVWGVPLVAVATALGAGLAGRYDLLPALLGLSVAVVGAGQGVSAVSSALAPYRVPEPGANPFATPPGSAVATVVAQLATSALITVLASPALAVLVAAALVARPELVAALSWAGLVVGCATGVGALWAGVVGGGRVFDRRGPELLAALAR